jgi:hypothetical protein
MNIIGKILVILNLIFALVVGGFLIFDFATRTNWKNSFEALKREMDVASRQTSVSGKTMQELNAQVKRAEAEKEKLKQDLVEQQTIAKVNQQNQTLLIQEAEARAKDADLSAQKAIAEAVRFKTEVKTLTDTVQNRDTTILELQTDNKKYRTEAIAQEELAKTTQRRNISLLEQLAEAHRQIALGAAGVRSDNVFPKDLNTPNPPSTYVKGKIDKVDPVDRNVVQISLGSDQGLKQNHTLDVYRLSPNPQYLGMIRIRDVKEHTAVGQLMRTSASGNHVLQAGDIVASSTRPQSP